MTKKELQPVKGIRDGLHLDFTGPEPDSCTTVFRAGAGRIIVPHRPRIDGIYDDQYQTRQKSLLQMQYQQLQT